MINTLSTPIANSLIADSPIADSPIAPTLNCSRDRINSAGSALGRAVSGFAFVGVLAATNELFGPDGLALSCVLATLAVGAKFFTTARRRQD